MAKRPAWSVRNGRVICREFDFVWTNGTLPVTFRKNSISLDQAVVEAYGRDL